MQDLSSKETKTFSLTLFFGIFHSILAIPKKDKSILDGHYLVDLMSLE